MLSFSHELLKTTLFPIFDFDFNKPFPQYNSAIFSKEFAKYQGNLIILEAEKAENKDQQQIKKISYQFQFLSFPPKEVESLNLKYKLLHHDIILIKELRNSLSNLGEGVHCMTATATHSMEDFGFELGLLKSVHDEENIAEIHIETRVEYLPFTKFYILSHAFLFYLLNQLRSHVKDYVLYESKSVHSEKTIDIKKFILSILKFLFDITKKDIKILRFKTWEFSNFSPVTFRWEILHADLNILETVSGETLLQEKFANIYFEDLFKILEKLEYLLKFFIVAMMDIIIRGVDKEELLKYYFSSKFSTNSYIEIYSKIEKEFF